MEDVTDAFNLLVNQDIINLNVLQIYEKKL